MQYAVPLKEKKFFALRLTPSLLIGHDCGVCSVLYSTLNC